MKLQSRIEAANAKRVLKIRTKHGGFKAVAGKCNGSRLRALRLQRRLSARRTNPADLRGLAYESEPCILCDKVTEAGNRGRGGNMADLFDVRQKKVMVTGGGGGLGRGVAEGLLEAGAEVVLIGSSEKAALAEREFRARGLNAHSVRADISVQEELERGFAKALAALGGEVDVLINAAGILRRCPSAEYSIADWNAVMSVNLTAMFLLAQLAARSMIQRGKGGKIINFASLVSFLGGQNVPAYAASKGGVAQLTKALSNDWARFGVNVNAIAPGYFETQMNAALVGDEQRSREVTERIPLGRWGVPEDLKGIAIFLSSGASDYICGAVIPVDGGYLCK